MIQQTGGTPALEQPTWVGPSAALFWVPALARGEAAAWARDRARDFADGGLARNDLFSLGLLATLLHALAVERRPPGPDRRAILMALNCAPVAVDITLAPAQGDRVEALDRLLGVGTADVPTSGVAEATRNGVDARQCLRFAYHDPVTGLGSTSGELWVTAAVACRRDLPALGATDLVATASTPQVDALPFLLPHLADAVTGQSLLGAAGEPGPDGPDGPTGS